MKFSILLVAFTACAFAEMKVTLLIYSGVPNPTFTLTPVEEKHFLAIASPLTLRQGVQEDLIDLGYSGFLVSDSRRNSPITAFHVLGDQHAEKYLLALALAKRVIDPELVSFDDIMHERVRFPKLQDFNVTGATSNARYIPSQPDIVHPYSCNYHPCAEYYNQGGVCNSNNCYAYSTYIRTDTFPQPGRAHGRQYSSLSCSSVYPAAQADGLIGVGKPGSGGPSSGHYVCLVVWPGRDYHWYRRDNTGYWSHKPGGTPARDTDSSGRRITDPETANRGGYTDVCGWFLVRPSTAVIQ